MIPSLNVTLTWFVGLGYAIGHGSNCAGIAKNLARSTS